MRKKGNSTEQMKTSSGRELNRSSQSASDGSTSKEIIRKRELADTSSFQALADSERDLINVVVTRLIKFLRDGDRSEERIWC